MIQGVATDAVSLLARSVSAMRTTKVPIVSSLPTGKVCERKEKRSRSE